MVTGSARWPTLPNVPTVAEAGFPAATSNSWMGIVAPVGTPKPVIDRLNTQIAAILEERSIKDAFLKMGMGVAGGSAERFNDQLARDLAVYQKLVTDINLKVE
jgi:tripartite-type tricarboxylate transporter receptor subunit TctC